MTLDPTLKPAPHVTAPQLVAKSGSRLVVGGAIGAASQLTRRSDGRDAVVNPAKP